MSGVYFDDGPENTSVPFQSLYNRRPLPGYAGHVKTSECADNTVGKGSEREVKMESTSHATYRKHPDEDYIHCGAQTDNKHKGPLSRMVTLTHPFNPFTQQSAYSNMAATNTTSSD